MVIEKVRWHRKVMLGGVFVTLIVVMGFGIPCAAQEAAEEVSEEAIEEAIQRSFEEEITVTGTLIPRADLTALSPVTVLEVDKELTYTGVTRIEDLVMSLPQVFAGQNSTIANGASGMATVDLRDLGPERTLVLVNGRRMAGGDPWQGSDSFAPDINAIPAPLVKRVDVLTGGASTAYGTDAVAGVVNFVMDTDFEGVRGGIQYSFFQHDNSNSLAQQINADAGFDFPSGDARDGYGLNAYMAMGGKFGDGKGHAVGYVSYREIDEVLKGYRDYVTCSVSSGDTGPECGGSSTIAEGRFIAYNADGSDNGDYMVQGNEFVPRAGTVFNYGPYNHLQRPDEKWSLGAFTHYTVNDYFEPYAEIMYTTNFTDAQIAYTGTFFNTSQINCDNPLMSEQQRETICGEGTGYGPTDYAEVYLGKRNVDGEPRYNSLGHDNLRLVAGVRGDINDQWSYDLYALHAQNNSTDVYHNDMSIARLTLALDVIEDPDTGEPVCRSGGDCVPYNVFEEGAVTDEMLDYLYADLSMSGRIKTQTVNGSLTGDLEDYGIMFPSASEGVQLAIGAEYRYEWLRNAPDEIYQFGGATGQGGGVPQVEASYNVTEAFVEAAVPLIQDAPGARDLTLELGYRYSDYSTFGTFNTYKGLMNWAMTDSFRIRGGFNRAVRAPNMWELFVPSRYGLGGSADICAGENPTATPEECARTGVPLDAYGNVLANPADQYNTLGGGNPLLDAEEADTITAGIVWTPEAIPGMSITLDYYDIQIADQIGSLGFDDILQQCANTGDPALCGLIHRDSLNTLWLTRDGFIETTNQNIGEQHSEGIDVNFSYLFDLGGPGFLSTDLMGTYLMTSEFTDPLVSYDCVGYFGFQCGQSASEWRHRARLTWETKADITLTLAWRYIGEVEIDDASPDADIGDPDAMAEWEINDIAKIDAHNWFDIAATYSFANGIMFTLGVNNVLDEEPPLAPTLNDDYGVNLYANYDPLGRYVFTSMQFKF